MREGNGVDQEQDCRGAGFIAATGQFETGCRGGDDESDKGSRQNLPTFLRPFCQRFREARNQRVIDAFLTHLPFDIRGVIRQLSRKLSDPREQFVRIKPDFLS